MRSAPPDVARAGSRPEPGEGLAELRRSGTVTELLFLYECATREPTQLRPVAARLGLTVQAASHSFRQLKQRGLVEVRDGHYRPTVEGVAWLHGSLGRLADDVRERIDRLHVIRSCRAIAGSDLEAGAPVSLEIRDGVLTARPGGNGPSHGRATRGAAAGTLVEISELGGIVPIVPARVSVRTLSDADLADPQLERRLRRELPSAPALVAAQGLEAYHSLRRSADRPIVRFAVGAACLEAARIGVPSLIVVLDRDLPDLLSAFSVVVPPPLDVRPVRSLGRPPRGRRGRRDGVR